jgi:hypothetical protein
MTKVDFKKTHKEWYLPSSENVALLTIPKLKFLQVEGTGYPGKSASFGPAVEALYGMAYTLKFMFKDQPKPDGWFEYVVPPLEGLWWIKNGDTFDMNRPDDWCWTAMIMVPDFITPAMVDTARQQLKEKKNPSSLPLVLLESFEEGKVVQILHIGGYDKEGPTIEKLHAFAASKGLKIRGKHHEIYLSDPGRTAPEKMKTVLRQPVE